MKKLFILLFLVLLFSCKGTKNISGNTADFTIENIAKIASAEDLGKKYPNANIKNDKGVFEEGTVERAYSVLYQNTPDEVLITWENEKVYDVTVSGNGKWKSKTGINVGTTYDELVKLIGKPIKVYGFGWDYSGAVDWNDGKLEKSGIHVFLTPTGDFPEKFYGDSIINPTEKELENLDLRVGNILYKAQK